jgi:hypothetical protein
VSQSDAETVVAPSFEILEADMHRNVALLVSILVSFLSYPYLSYPLLIDKPFSEAKHVSALGVTTMILHLRVDSAYIYIV